VDRLGRILIPPSLREHAGLGEQATWAGTVDRIEVWSPERWAEAQKAARGPKARAVLAARLHQLL
jgi:MraZ protein